MSKGIEKWIRDELFTVLPKYPRIFLDSFLTFRSNQVPIRAAALTYTTLLALVPFLVILFSVAGKLGYLQLVLNLLPQVNSTFKINLPLDKIDTIIHQVQRVELSNMGIIGSIGLFVSFVLAMGTLETAMNIIWEAPKSRGFFSKVINYIPFLIFLILFILLFSWMLLRLKEYLDTLFQGNILERLEHGVQFTVILALLVGLNWLFFVVLFYLIPHTKVQWISAVMGATFTTPVLYLLGFLVGLFGSYLFNSYSALYGSLAIFPLLMLVLYISWILVLYGVVLTKAHQEAHEIT